MKQIPTRSNFRMRYKGLCISNCNLPTRCPHYNVCRKVFIQNEILDNNLELVLFNLNLFSNEKH